MATWTGDDNRETRKAMVAWIASHEADPALWMLVARAMCGRLGISATSTLPLGTTLAAVCQAIVDECRKQNMSPADVRQIACGQ